MEIDFTNYIMPTIVPYHLLAFWTGIWDPPTIHNLQAFQTLVDLSLGFQFDYSDLTIELFSITRQRILQHASTTVMIYDFEDGQYLLRHTGWQEILRFTKWALTEMWRHRSYVPSPTENGIPMPIHEHGSPRFHPIWPGHIASHGRI